MAKERKAKLFIDAEQSHLQDGVRIIALALMEKFNGDGEVVVANTYQCYLKRTRQQVTEDMEVAERRKFQLGLKLVRGAYLDFEKRYCASLGKHSPVFDTYDQTNANYNRWVG